ncbi:bile acid:sodium symporter [Halioglobus sp.]|nr:bile acid:sodium symporter [Halioglobus sp.]
MLNEFFSHYADYEYLLASSQLFLAMLGMGALLAPKDFISEVRQPRSLCIGLGFQWMLVPVIALAVAALAPVPTGVAIGIMLIAAVPGGTLSNILTHFGRGNIALSISLTSITTVAALITTPLLLQLMMAEHLPDNFEMPTMDIARDILLTLIFPLLAGMVIKVKTPEITSERFSKWLIRASLLLVVMMAIGASGSGRLNPQAYGAISIGVVVLFCIALKLASVAVARVTNIPARDGLAVVVEATFRNLSLAVAVKAIVFPAQSGIVDPIGDAVLFTTFLYGIISVFVTLFPVFYHQRVLAKIR